jgi:hypothetical protein
MEIINDNDRSPLAEKYLADIKDQITQGGIDDKIRNDNLDKVIMDLEWYMRARKLFEAGKKDESTKIMEANPNRYDALNAKYGSVNGETPKLSTRELELLIQDVKNLPNILFSSQKIMEE